MLKSFIDYESCEIEEIVSNLEPKKSSAFFSAQSHEGCGEIINAVIMNLVGKGYKVAYLDLNTAISGIHKFEDETSEKYCSLLSNNVMKQKSLEYPELLEKYYFSNDKIYSKEREQLVITIEELVLNIKKDFDYIIIRATPLVRFNKNNINLRELKKIIDNFYFVLKSNNIPKMKLVKMFQLFEENGIEFKGVCVNDFKIPNFFDDLIRQINKIKIVPKKYSEGLRRRLLEFKYITKL